MANPYDFNPFAPPVPKQPGIDPQTGQPIVPPVQVGQQNPYARWATWRQPTDETARKYYTYEQPRVGYQQFQEAWGQPNGNLQRFIDSQFGRVWADYIKQSEAKKVGGGEGFLFPDVLTKQLGDSLQNQWQGQTAYQRGENYGTMGAGRRT